MNNDLNKIVELRHDRPHQILGPHRLPGDQRLVIRAFIPDAAEISVFIKRPVKKIVNMQKIHSDGLFEAQIAAKVDAGSLEYVFRVTDMSKRRSALRDAYQFLPADLNSDQEACFLAGEQCFLFRLLGAQCETRDTISGVRFGFWAPNAQRVSAVGTFNRWDSRCHPMQRIGASGLWELFIPGVKDGDFYKFEIRTPSGDIVMKTDPYAFRIEDAAEAAAIVCNLEQAHHWRDEKWREQKAPHGPAVFKFDSTQQTCAELLDITEDDLLRLREEGYSHLEVPAFCVWNSEDPTFFSPHPGFGTPSQVMGLVDRCHRQGLGVLIGSLALRFPAAQKDPVHFDGGLVNELLKDPAQDAFCFDRNNPGVKNLLLSYVRFWQQHYHIDGFRVDGENYFLYRHLIAAFAAENVNLLWLVDDLEPAFTPAKEVIKRLFFNRRLIDPFTVLGPHKQLFKKAASIRAILPRARQAYVNFPDQPEVFYEMQPICETGLWQAMIPLGQVEQPYRLHTFDAEGRHDDKLDTYAFDVSYIKDADKKLFADGKHYRIYQVLGSHQRHCADVEGVSFAVWAPNAVAVNVVGDFNRWEGGGHPLRFHPDAGIWELFVPAVRSGAHYQFEIHTQNGERLLKSDPYAFFTQTAPDTDSVVYPVEGIYAWQDQEWMAQRRRINVWRMPVSIYEVHLGSWLRGPGKRHLTYSELADRLIPYVKDMGFTHIEILPIAEHPYEPSWGYQVSNFYASTSRLGKPEELMAFVDRCHQNGIGVLLDWVAGHFPKDAHALAKFDGTHLYEHEDPRKGEHKDWGTLIFNYGRREVENFLIANALFWLEHYHFDGLRVDAVASMLYLDYSRKAGEWLPNIYGGNENLEAIEFLKHANYIVHGRFPGVLMIAEESTAWAGVSRPADSGGLGFGFKWNMGWMHDVLGYLQTPPEYRPYHHNRLTFVLHYAFDENFVLSLSHDEVVHLKGSLYAKMPGSEWEKFANLRLLFFFMFTHPGKKLNFMGSEFAQINEWSESGSLQWQVLHNEPHQRLKFYFKSLNKLYRNEPELHEMDCKPVGFEWIDANNHEQSIIVFSRKAKDPRIALIVVINFSAISRFDFRIGVPYPVSYTRIFNTNDVSFGGLSTQEPEATYAAMDTPWHQQQFSIRIDRLPALSAMLLRPVLP
ncbi:MAG: 1,4-alpha-glucan branching protein GlgB [Methylococcales bacterium]|nr:1,4-alpha-glucan branching protein GlgB [Methylococcales bacterium]